MANYEKGKRDAITAFSHQNKSFPIWKMHDVGKKIIVDSNLHEQNPDKSTELLKNAFEKLTPGCLYCLSLYKSGRRSHGKENSSITFMNDDSEKVGAAEEKQTAQPTKIAYENTIQPPAASERIGLSEHIALIQSKAGAEAKLMYMEGIVSDQTKYIAELEAELKKCEEEIEELENEIETLEEAEEEEEAEAVAGTEKVTLESALAGLIKENGGLVIENLFNKGLKEDIGITEETDNATVNGITSDLYERYSVEALNVEMLTLNPQWKKHLFKLVQIGQQKPNTFRMLLKKLEDY